MTKFLLWLILFLLCWPLAFLALIIFPIVWLLSIPFRIFGIAVEAIIELFRAIVMLPSRLLKGRN